MPLSPSRFLVLATLVLLPLAGAQAADYVVRSEDPNVLYEPKPELPSLKPFTRAAVMAKIGSRQPGEVSSARMVHLDPMNEFVGGDGRLAVWAARQRPQQPPAGGHGLLLLLFFLFSFFFFRLQTIRPKMFHPKFVWSPIII